MKKIENAGVGVKSYARRDSATAFLRKAGVKSEHYKDFLRAKDDLFEIDPAEVQAYLDGVAAPKRETAKPKKPKGSRILNTRTVSGFTRALILNGADNNEVWKQLKAEFNLDDSKRHYPAWYRSEMKRKNFSVPKSRIASNVF